MTMKARVFVTLKPSVFDPQGHTITDALQSLGYMTVADVRQGKYFELDLNVATAAEAEKLAAEVADRVLANPVIESYRIELAGPASALAAGPAAKRRRGLPAAEN
jgi:phosphoribosylformylglycinamidine synthase PurS subunit